MAKKLVTCDCLGTLSYDAGKLSEVTGLEVLAPCTALCTKELKTAAQHIESGDAILACGQEAARFDALAQDLGRAPLPTVDLRDRAGWSADPAGKTPKMAALLADAGLPKAVPKSRDVFSEGLCLILGSGEIAMDAARRLAPYLSVTLLLPEADPETAPQEFDIAIGRLRRAEGALGGFTVVIDRLQEIAPGGRGARQPSAPQDGGTSVCDIILDLTGNPPLFPAPEKREGYLRADPNHPPSVAAATLAASHLVGTFEKPLYVHTEAILCAHSRAEQTACTRCLDLCPTGAITPEGDHVAVDPMICAGCGACSAVCPSGAIRFEAPAPDEMIARAQTLAKTYLDAGGADPSLVVHGSHGAEVIRLAARFGAGLPAHAIPLEIPSVNAFGHAEIVASLAAGMTRVTLIPDPGTDIAALDAQVDLARTISGSGAISIWHGTDPDDLSETLVKAAPGSAPQTPVRPLGTRRQITRAAARALRPDTEAISLPQGAPYGAVLVNTDSCTLCLSCVSLCPSGALGDNPDRPELRFQEDACLQCGLCASVCPEDAITYEPQLNLSEGALSQVILNEEEPFACIECGALFGSKSTIERITEKLTGHAMFADAGKLAMIQMCDNCRVNAQFHSDDNPFAGGERPRTRTTEDYLSKRRDH